jgi:hypothetical protein
MTVFVRSWQVVSGFDTHFFPPWQFLSGHDSFFSGHCLRQRRGAAALQWRFNIAVLLQWRLGVGVAALQPSKGEPMLQQWCNAKAAWRCSGALPLHSLNMAMASGAAAQRRDGEALMRRIVAAAPCQYNASTLHPDSDAAGFQHSSTSSSCSAAAYYNINMCNNPWAFFTSASNKHMLTALEKSSACQSSLSANIYKAYSFLCFTQNFNSLSALQSSTIRYLVSLARRDIRRGANAHKISETMYARKLKHMEHNQNAHGDVQRRTRNGVDQQRHVGQHLLRNVMRSYVLCELSSTLGQTSCNGRDVNTCQWMESDYTHLSRISSLT